MSQTIQEGDYSRSDFMPGDVIRFRNGLGVVVDAIVQVGDPPAYGYSWGESEGALVARTKGQQERRHIAPDRYQDDEGTPDKFAVTQGSNDRSTVLVDCEQALDKNPSDCKYNNGTGVTNLPARDYFDPEAIEMPEYLDRRYYHD